MSLIKQNYKTMSQFPRQADLCEPGHQPGWGLRLGGDGAAKTSLSGGAVLGQHEPLP